MNHPARRSWQAVATLHVATDFGLQCRDAASAAGPRGFWTDDVAYRAACGGTGWIRFPNPMGLPRPERP